MLHSIPLAKTRGLAADVGDVRGAKPWLSQDPSGCPLRRLLILAAESPQKQPLRCMKGFTLGNECVTANTWPMWLSSHSMVGSGKGLGSDVDQHAASGPDTHFRVLWDAQKRLDSWIRPSMNPRDLVFVCKPATVEAVVQDSANACAYHSHKGFRSEEFEFRCPFLTATRPEHVLKEERSMAMINWFRDGQILRDEIHAGFSPKFNISVSAPGAEDGAGPNAPLTAEPAGGRVWQACLACRRKKVRRKDESVQKIIPGAKMQDRSNAMVNNLVTTAAPETRIASFPEPKTMHQQADTAQESVAGLRTFPRVHDTDTTLNSNMHPNRAVAPLCVRQSRVNDELQENSSGSEDSDTNDDDRQNGNAEQREDEHVGQAGALVRDSYGRPRPDLSAEPLTTYWLKLQRVCCLRSPLQTPSSTGASQSALSTEDLELPLFVRGKVWPELPFIPKPEDLPRPPQYIADLLIGLYFDKLHYTQRLNPCFARQGPL
ncbi:transcriptional regulatory protein [Diaporthe eres]|nr:transcriptional regulatory protein [Diaporthe eres]